MAGREVTRQLLDMKAAEAIVAVRHAFEKVETVKEFLSTVPSDAPGGDPLTLPTNPTDALDSDSAAGKFGYTADEAYLIRYLFESLMQFDIKALLKDGRKLTGLE